MTLTLQNENIISLRVRITSSKLGTFINWQSSLNSSIGKFHGFVSLEIIAPQGSMQTTVHSPPIAEMGATMVLIQAISLLKTHG